MKVASCIITAWAFFGNAQAFSPPHPCKAFPIKVSKLQHCATAFDFCSDYLGGTASFTRTTTSTSTVPHSTTTSYTIETDTSYTTTGTTVITADATTTTTTASTTTVTTTQAVCPATGDARLANRAKASCGIASTANPSEVSGACNCILASSTTTVTTETVGGPIPDATFVTSTTTSIEDDEATTYTTPTSTVIATSTVTACTTPCVVPSATSLSNPNRITTQYVFNADGAIPFDSPFPISFYGISSSSLVVSVDGYVAIKGGIADKNGTQGYGFDNQPIPAFDPDYASDPYSVMPDTSVAPFWSDLHVGPPYLEGVFYQISGEVGSRTLALEWYVEDDNSNIYDFTLSFSEADPNDVRFAYIEIGDEMWSSTVGAQSLSGGMSSTQFSYNAQYHQNLIMPGMVLQYNALLDIFEPATC